MNRFKVKCGWTFLFNAARHMNDHCFFFSEGSNPVARRSTVLRQKTVWTFGVKIPTGIPTYLQDETCPSDIPLTTDIEVDWSGTKSWP